MNRYDHLQLIKMLEEFSAKVEEITFTVLVYCGAKVRDREELRSFVYMLEHSPFKISTGVPTPILEQVQERTKNLVDQFPDDRSLIRMRSLLTEVINVRNGIKQHFFKHHEGSERLWLRREWETIHSIEEEINDISSGEEKFPELDIPEPLDRCDHCGESFDFEDLVEVEPIDQETGKPKPVKEFWCDSCLKSGNQSHSTDETDSSQS